MKILMVVDQPEIWELHIAVLTFFHKHEVVVVTDTELALRALQEAPYDVMIIEELLAPGVNDPLRGTCASDHERGFRFLRFVGSRNRHAVKRAILIVSTCHLLGDDLIATCRIPIQQMRLPIMADDLLTAVEK